ncbi:hypothetical protein GCM10023196_005000 [Actinoallomurus vinaceus]|uniref:Nudix hydrolase domain-containing protein n=1 Tax=Actinoallomurus vinaceus TaxID=1080074 RepID=A0ABP8U2Y2_9ACTN
MSRAAQPDSEEVVRVLRAVPPSVEGAKTSAELAELAGLGPDGAGRVDAVLAVLKAFGVLAVRPGPDGGARFKAATPLATSFIRSVAEYLANDSSILRNWGRTGVSDAPYSDSLVLSGPQFLFAMEQNRLSGRGDSAVPLDRVEIAQAVIKAASGPGRDARYLVQYDGRARQYQLIGGHRRHDDLTIEHTVIRELEEELTDFTFDHRTDSLVELQRIASKRVSRTYAVLTHYDITIYLLRGRRERLTLGPMDRWVTERELLDGRTTDGTPIIFGLVGLPDGLSGLEPTLPAVRRATTLDVIRRHPWEAAGIVLAVLGLIASIIPLF